MVNTATGEIITQGVYMKKEYGYYDMEESTKIFVNNSELITTLTSPGIKLFFYVASNLQKGSDKVYIAPYSVKKFTGYTSNGDVYKGISELLEKRIIAKSDEQLIYFINPNVLFSGSKADLLEEFPKRNF